MNRTPTVLEPNAFTIVLSSRMTIRRKYMINHSTILVNSHRDHHTLHNSPTCIMLVLNITHALNISETGGVTCEKSLEPDDFFQLETTSPIRKPRSR